MTTGTDIQRIATYVYGLILIDCAEGMFGHDTESWTACCGSCGSNGASHTDSCPECHGCGVTITDSAQIADFLYHEGFAWHEYLACCPVFEAHWNGCHEYPIDMFESIVSLIRSMFAGDYPEVTR